MTVEGVIIAMNGRRVKNCDINKTHIILVPIPILVLLMYIIWYTGMHTACCYNTHTYIYIYIGKQPARILYIIL